MLGVIEEINTTIPRIIRRIPKSFCFFMEKLLFGIEKE
jgi:hypothetical protein